MKKLTNRQSNAIDKASREYIDFIEQTESMLNNVDGFSFGLSTWQHLNGAFHEGVEWAIKHHKLLGI